MSKQFHGSRFYGTHGTRHAWSRAFMSALFVFAMASCADAPAETSATMSGQLGLKSSGPYSIQITSANDPRITNLGGGYKKLTINANMCGAGCTGVLVSGINLDAGPNDTNVVRVDGVSNVKIEGCNLSGGETGVFIVGATNVDIVNNVIHGQSDINTADTDLTGRGVRVSNSVNSTNIYIGANEIHDVTSDGVLIAERDDLGIAHAGIEIVNNNIHDVARNALFWPGHYHGLYIQSGGVLVDGNTVTNVADGNGISLRGSAVVTNNVVTNVGKAGIAYFADHNRGPSNSMLIQSNTVEITGQNVDSCCSGQPAIRLLAVPTSSAYHPANPRLDPTWYVQNFDISSNQVTDASQIVNDEPSLFTVDIHDNSSSFTASEDTYVRNGSYANTTYGTAQDLVVKGASGAGFYRETYLKFNVASLPASASTVALNLYVRSLPNGAPVTLTLHALSNDTWSESTLTYQNRPSAGSALASATVTAPGWVSLNLAPVYGSLGASDGVASFVLRDDGMSNLAVNIDSRERGATAPSLTIAD